MEEKKDIKSRDNLNFLKDEDLIKQKPRPVASCNYYEFNDFKKDQIVHCSFILRNLGGPYKEFGIQIDAEDASEPENSFLKIAEIEPAVENQPEKLPLKVFFEAKAIEWSKRYSGKIIARLDDEEEVISVNLDTQTKPVNDFARIFSEKEIQKITSLIVKLEKLTSTEISVVTIDSLDGKTLEKFATDLFNEWGIGKEDKNNGILFIINIADNSFRIEVGKGVENIITPGFISYTSEKYIIPNFKNNRFGNGTYFAITDIFAEIYRDYKKENQK